jgi:uncharacterized protein (UPF0548 family)
VGLLLPRFARPADAELARFLRAQHGAPLSYSPIGSSELPAHPGFDVDHHRVRLGAGRATFERASAALRAWTMFDVGWVESWPRDAPIAEGTLVAIVARVGPFVSTNACRIVRVDDEDGPVRRFGFAYGTLHAHVERGEERFRIEHHAEDDSVWYDLRAQSRPGPLWARCARPWLRRLQRRFARDSLARMRRAIEEDGR